MRKITSNIFRFCCKRQCRTAWLADRTGILLSGGLDSGTVAATARELSSGAGGTTDLRAYTVVYESLIPDQEGRYAREVAEFLKIPMTLSSRWMSCSRSNAGTIRASARPNLLTIHFLRASSISFGRSLGDCRVVLSGEGADNLMHFEMWPFVRDMMRNQRVASACSRETPRYLWLRPSVFAGTQAARAGTFRERSHCAHIIRRWLAPDFARRLNLKDRAKEWSELPTFRPHPDSSQGPRLSFLAALVCRMFDQENPGLTRCPVEVRYPFLDLRIVNFLLAIPPFPVIFDKTLLRHAVAGRLPESVRTRPKTPLAGESVARTPETIAKRADGSDTMGTRDGCLR